MNTFSAIAGFATDQPEGSQYAPGSHRKRATVRVVQCPGGWAIELLNWTPTGHVEAELLPQIFASEGLAEVTARNALTAERAEMSEIEADAADQDVDVTLTEQAGGEESKEETHELL